MEGEQISDILKLADPSLAFRQTIAVVKSTTNFRVNCVEDGVMGLGFQSISRNNIPTPIQSLRSQSLINKMVFGLYLSPPSSSSRFGTLTIGDFDPSHYVEGLHWVPLAKRSLREM